MRIIHNWTIENKLYSTIKFLNQVYILHIINGRFLIQFLSSSSLGQNIRKEEYSKDLNR